MLKERLGLIGSSSFPAKIIYSKWERIYCRILSFKRDIYATICMVMDTSVVMMQLYQGNKALQLKTATANWYLSKLLASKSGGTLKAL